MIRYVIVDYRLIDHAVYVHGMSRQTGRKAMLPQTSRCPICGWRVVE